MAELEQLGISIISPLRQVWESFVRSVPGLLAGIIVILVGYILGSLVAAGLNRLFERIRFDRWAVDKTHLRHVLGDFKVGEFFAQIAKWSIMVPFLAEAARTTDLIALSNFLNQISLYIPNAIVALLIAFFGLAISEYVSDLIRATKGRGADILAGVAKTIILVFLALVVLDQIGIAVSVARNSFLIVLSGIMLALALALGIGFGLGLKDEARNIVRDFKKKL